MLLQAVVIEAVSWCWSIWCCVGCDRSLTGCSVLFGPNLHICVIRSCLHTLHKYPSGCSCIGYVYFDVVRWFPFMYSCGIFPLSSTRSESHVTRKYFLHALIHLRCILVRAGIDIALSIMLISFWYRLGIVHSLSIWRLMLYLLNSFHIYTSFDVSVKYS